MTTATSDRDQALAEQIAMLKRYRAHHGWTPGQAAAATGVSPSTWRNWETSIALPQRSFLMRLLAESMSPADAGKMKARPSSKARDAG